MLSGRREPSGARGPGEGQEGQRGQDGVGGCGGFGGSRMASPARAARYSSRSAAMAGPRVQKEPQQLPLRDWGGQGHPTSHGGHWRPDPHPSTQRDTDPQAPVSASHKGLQVLPPRDAGILFPPATPLKGPRYPVPTCSPLLRDPSVSPKGPGYLIHPLKGIQLFPRGTWASCCPAPHPPRALRYPVLPTPKDPGVPSEGP